VIILVAAACADGAGIELKDGDRVVLVGNTFIERDQEYGYLETLLTLHYPDRNITFRNLGWSGDTVEGIARARFGKVEEGFQHLKDHVLALKPTVLLVGYGMNESFEGGKGLARFQKDLDHLLDVLSEIKARMVLISPVRHEDLGRPLPEPSRHNSDLRMYCALLRKAAERRGALYVDLFETLEMHRPAGERLTDDGMHLTPLGYWHAARAIAAVLEPNPGQNDPWRISVKLDLAGRAADVHGWTIGKIETTAEGLRFEATADSLPPPPRPVSPGDKASAGEMLGQLQLELKGEGPAFGQARLKLDGRAVPLVPVVGGSSPHLAFVPPDYDRVELLRAVINAKNLLYFHRWRPQNETYLFGFRKHEQGQNAREIPLFDPLVAEKEQEVTTLRKPVVHKYELIFETRSR
jgi:lysophospholipase L1-like esterase